MMYWYGNGMSGWGYTLMAINMVVFWGLAIAGIVVLVRFLGDGPRRTSNARLGQTPERILASRFAHGDIDDEEYRRRMDLLGGHAKP